MSETKRAHCVCGPREKVRRILYTREHFLFFFTFIMLYIYSRRIDEKCETCAFFYIGFVTGCNLSSIQQYIHYTVVGPKSSWQSKNDTCFARVRPSPVHHQLSGAKNRPTSIFVYIYIIYIRQIADTYMNMIKATHRFLSALSDASVSSRWD